MALYGFEIADSRVPGVGPDSDLEYTAHISGMCTVQAWLPSGGFQGSPWIMAIHGGLNSNPGRDAARPARMGAGIHQLCSDLLQNYGWPIFAITFPPSSFNTQPVYDHFGRALWPTQELCTALAFQFICENWSGTTGIDATPHGVTMLGPGNTIDPTKGVSVGNSSGGAQSLLLGVQPHGHYPFAPGELAATMRARSPKYSHRPAAIVTRSAQTEWTQFAFDPAITFDSTIHGTGAKVYKDGKQQHYQEINSPRLWSTIPPQWKIASSAYHWINAGYLPPPIHGMWNSTDSDGRNLTWEDWNPGFIAGDIAGGRAFTNPHHEWQAETLWRALRARDTSTPHIIRWGDAERNPWADRLNLSDPAEYSQEVTDWLHTTLKLRAA